MNSKKIYQLAAHEVIINGKTNTDLGDYILQYNVLPDTIYRSDMVDDFALALAVKVVRKQDNTVIWGDIFYKVIEKNTNFSQYSEEAKKKIDAIFDMTLEEKMDFINKKENFFGKKYKKSNLVDPSHAEFFKGLNFDAYDGWDSFALGGYLKTDAASEIGEKYETIIEDYNVGRKK